jgi:Holliday junction resolvase RusA-like endonuclease
MSDWDNPVKPLQDILQKKYGFNDKDIFQGTVSKRKVNKGEEYFLVKLETFNNQ